MCVIASATNWRSLADVRPNKPSAAKRPMRTTSTERMGTTNRAVCACPRYAMRLGREPGVPPSTCSEPASDGMRPSIAFNKVDLPEPLVPTSANDSPGRNESVMPSTTGSLP
jgi:hypothetical protein